jgi:hypothetical protein
VKFFQRFLLLVSLLAVSSLTNAQLVNGRFSTSVYAWQQFDTVGVSQTLARGFQTLQLEVSQGDVSLRTSMYGATNFSQSFGNDGLIRINNLYLRWKNVEDAMDLSLGRIPVFAGVGNGTLDGALIKARGMDERVWFTAYGGANVLPDLKSMSFSDLDQKFLIGSQLITTLIPQARIGVSYVNRHIPRESYWATRPDSLFNPTTVLIVPDSRAQQAVGVDARYDQDGAYSVYSRYDYDLNSKYTLRGQFGARVQTSDQLALTGDFIYREPYVPFNSFFTVFPVSPIRELEGGIEYSVSPSYHAFGRFAYVGYVDALSRRITVGMNADYGSISYAGSSGYAGILNSFYVQGMYPLLDRTLVPTVGFSYSKYRLSEEATQDDNVFAGSFGAVVRPSSLISVDAQVQWLHNDIASHDVRLLVNVNYWFNHNFKFLQHKEASE